MAITTTWSVSNMTHVDADGGVNTRLLVTGAAASDAGGDETATEGGEK